jgi:hypothetical protein
MLVDRRRPPRGTTLDAMAAHGFDFLLRPGPTTGSDDEFDYLT